MIRKQQLFLLAFLLLALLAPVHAFAGAVDGTCDLQALSGIAAHRKAAAAQKAGAAAAPEAPAVTLRSLENAERELRSSPEAATAGADRLVEAGDEVSPELSDSLARLESLQAEAAARAPKKPARVAKVESLPQEVKKVSVPEPEPSIAPVAAAKKAEVFSPSETIQARGPPARVPNALKGKEGKYEAKPVSLQDIPDGSVMEGSVGYGGIQPDYIVNFHAPEFDELRTFAQDVGQMRIPVTEKIDRINKRIRNNVLPGKSYTNSRYRGVVNTYRSANQDIPLSEYANCKAGVCRENALITHMALKEAGIPNRYVYAKAKLKYYSPDSGKLVNEVAEDHAFVVTEINGKNWIVDSYNKAFNGFSFDQLRNPKLRKNTRLDALPFAEEQNDLVAGITEINGYPYVWVPKTAAARAEAKISQRAGVSTVRNAMVEPRPALPRAFWTRAQASRAAEIMMDGSDGVSRTIADGRRFMASEALSSEKISEISARNFRETAEYLANNVELLPLNRETAIKLNRMLTKGLVPENERGNYLFRTGPRVGGALEQTDEFVAGEPERFYKWLESEPAKEMGRKDPVALAEIIHNNLAALDSFPDGNGRLSRMMSDLALMKSGHPPAKYSEQADYFARGSPRSPVPREIRQQYYKEIVESGDESFRAEKTAVAKKAMQENPPPSVELQALKNKGTRDFWDDVDALKENERLKVYTRSPNGYEEPMMIVKRGDGKLYRDTVIGRKIEFTPAESEASGSGSLRVFLEKSKATMITEEEHEIAAIRGPDYVPARNIASLEEPSPVTVRNSMVDTSAPKFDPEKRYDAKTLEARIFAVHATEFFPEDGVIKAGASDVSRATASIAEEPPSFRPTTHWALGELVREHQASWENRPYAFVLPVGDLKKQLVNLNTYDTFTLGDFTLPEGAIAVVPEGFNKKIPPGVRVETYKPGTSLRGAVDRSIEKHGGWHIEMKAGRSPSLDSVGTIDGHSVNTADFFAPILRENPNVSFGDHIQSQVGTANRMGNVEQSINLLMKQYRSGGFVQDTKEVVFLRKFMDHQLAKLDQELPLSRFPKAAAATYQEKVRKLRDWLNVVDADLQLRKNHGLSIAGVNKTIAKKVESLRSDPQALHGYLFDDLKLKGLTMAEAGQEGIPSRSLATYLAGTPLSEAQDLTKFIEKEGLMAPADLQSAKLLYSVKRSLAVDLDKARSEGLLGEMESGFEALKNKPEVVGAAMDEIANYLDETSSRLPSALKMIEMPEVKSALEARYGMEIPEDGLTLDRFLRAHPETKGIYEEAPVARNTAGDAILAKLGRGEGGPDPEKISSFKSAKSAAWGKVWARESYAENLKGLQAPMRSARELKDVGAGNKLSIYEIMKRGDFGKPEQMWEKLGLKDQFRKMFPKDADFWKSRQSLEEIYTRLESGDTQRGWVDSLLGRRLAKQRAYEDLAADKRFTAQAGKIDKVLGSERREELLRGVSRLDGADQERFLNRLKTIADDPDSAELTMLREAMESTPPSCLRGASATESGMKGRMAWGQSLGLPRLAFMVFALLSPSEGIGGGNCPDLVVEALHRIVNPQTDTAVELELAANPNVMKLITTTDGKVSGLLQGQPAPQWFVDFVKEKVPFVQDPAQLSWDKLHNTVQRRLIKTVSAERKQKFFENREIKGLVHKKEVKLKFSKPTTFLGKRYEPGEHMVDVSRVFKGKVEHSGPDMSGNGVELHFRGNQAAGRMSNDAWKLLDGLGTQRKHQHVHVVAPLPMEKLTSNPKVGAAVMGDFYRRVNLASEMMTVAEDGARVTSKVSKDGEIIFFGPMDPEHLKGVTKYFRDVGEGRPPKIGDRYKMAWVGMRGSDKYDSPGLWGLEVRAIQASSDPVSVRNFLDAIQYDINEHAFGMADENMQKWMSKFHSQNGPDEAMEAAWYNRPWKTLIKDAAPEVKKRYSFFNDFLMSNRRALTKGQVNNDEAKMLVHNWSKDPLVYNKPELAQKIEQEQVRALDALKAGNKTNKVMKDFLLNSGLYEETMKSLGIAIRKKSDDVAPTLARLDRDVDSVPTQTAGTTVRNSMLDSFKRRTLPGEKNDLSQEKALELFEMSRGEGLSVQEKGQLAKFLEQRGINATLRSDQGTGLKSREMRVLDSAIYMAKQQMPEGSFLYRGEVVHPSQVAELGSTFEEYAYLSTSVDKNVAEKFAATSDGSVAVLKKIRIPENGQGGIYIPAFVEKYGADLHIAEKFKPEGEFLLPRGVKFRVAAEKEIKLSNGQPALLQELDIIRKSPESTAMAAKDSFWAADKPVMLPAGSRRQPIQYSLETRISHSDLYKYLMQDRQVRGGLEYASMGLVKAKDDGLWKHLIGEVPYTDGTFALKDIAKAVGVSEEEARSVVLRKGVDTTRKTFFLAELKKEAFESVVSAMLSPISKPRRELASVPEGLRLTRESAEDFYRVYRDTSLRFVEDHSLPLRDVSDASGVKVASSSISSPSEFHGLAEKEIYSRFGNADTGLRTMIPVDAMNIQEAGAIARAVEARGILRRAAESAENLGSVTGRKLESPSYLEKGVTAVNPIQGDHAPLRAYSIETRRFSSLDEGMADLQFATVLAQKKESLALNPRFNARPVGDAENLNGALKYTGELLAKKSDTDLQKIGSDLKKFGERIEAEEKITPELRAEVSDYLKSNDVLKKLDADAFLREEEKLANAGTVRNAMVNSGETDSSPIVRTHVRKQYSAAELAKESDQLIYGVRGIPGGTKAKVFEVEQAQTWGMPLEDTVALSRNFHGDMTTDLSLGVMAKGDLAEISKYPTNVPRAYQYAMKNFEPGTLSPETIKGVRYRADDVLAVPNGEDGLRMQARPGGLRRKGGSVNLKQAKVNPDVQERMKDYGIRVQQDEKGNTRLYYDRDPTDADLKLTADRINAVANAGIYSPEYVAAFTHQELAIFHGFPGGNGRTGRVIAQAQYKKLTGDSVHFPSSFYRELEFSPKELAGDLLKAQGRSPEEAVKLPVSPGEHESIRARLSDAQPRILENVPPPIARNVPVDLPPTVKVDERIMGKDYTFAKGEKSIEIKTADLPDEVVRNVDTLYIGKSLNSADQVDRQLRNLFQFGKGNRNAGTFDLSQHFRSTQEGPKTGLFSTSSSFKTAKSFGPGPNSPGYVLVVEGKDTPGIDFHAFDRHMAKIGRTDLSSLTSEHEIALTGVDPRQIRGAWVSYGKDSRTVYKGEGKGSFPTLEFVANPNYDPHWRFPRPERTPSPLVERGKTLYPEAYTKNVDPAVRAAIQLDAVRDLNKSDLRRAQLAQGNLDPKARARMLQEEEEFSARMAALRTRELYDADNVTAARALRDQATREHAGNAARFLGALGSEMKRAEDPTAAARLIDPEKVAKAHPSIFFQNTADAILNSPARSERGLFVHHLDSLPEAQRIQAWQAVTLLHEEIYRAIQSDGLTKVMAVDLADAHSLAAGAKTDAEKTALITKSLKAKEWREEQIADCLKSGLCNGSVKPGSSPFRETQASETARMVLLESALRTAPESAAAEARKIAGLPAQPKTVAEERKALGGTKVKLEQELKRKMKYAAEHPNDARAQAALSDVQRAQAAVTERIAALDGGKDVPSPASTVRNSMFGANDTKPSILDLPPTARRIDLKKTLFGIEYTFQDQKMVDEPGRMTFSTPHKRERFNELQRAYLEELGVNERGVASSGSDYFKPGSSFEVSGEGKHVLTMEPVTIEVNTPPKAFTDIEASAEKIFRASEKADLQAYVNPAAERSGMGHIHVGANKLSDSPFYRHPNLLRNLMVYEHKHPSTLWGFAEAYDIDDMRVIGNGSHTNIETYHRPQQQEALRRAVGKFDAWYETTLREQGDLSQGLGKFLGFLKEEQETGVDFFRHYRYINLEHLDSLANFDPRSAPSLTGKYTVEFRNFRPPRTAAHAQAHAELLLGLMERHSAPGHLEKFVSISPGQYDRFHSATRVAADWEQVKRDLPIYNPLWDDSVGEYVNVQLGRRPEIVELPNGLKAEVFPAFSPKVSKGEKFELRLPATSNRPPKVEMGGHRLELEGVELAGNRYWVATFDRASSSATIRNAMVESGSLVRGVAVYSKEYLDSSPSYLQSVVKFRDSSSDTLASVRRDYFAGIASFRELEGANRRYGQYDKAVVGAGEAARRIGYLQQEEEYMAREIAKAELDGEDISAMVIDHRALSAQLQGEVRARAAELGAGTRNAGEARRGVVESFKGTPKIRENFVPVYSHEEMAAALRKKGLSEDEITKCMDQGECGSLKYTAKERPPAVEPSLLAQKILMEKELSAAKAGEAEEVRAIARTSGRPTDLKEAKSLLESERKDLAKEARDLRKEAKQLSDEVKERHEELLDQYGRPSLYSAFTREGHGDVWHDDDPWREGPSDAARVKLWNELPDLNRNGNASFADLQKAAKKDGVTTVIPYPRPKTAIEEREMEMIYGSKLKFSTDKKKGVPYVKGKGVALHPGVEPELASIFRGDFNPHLGTGLAANRLDKWREYKLANTLSPGSMSETTNAPALFKKAAATSELAPAKREALKADVLSCIAHSNGVCSPALEERIRSAVQDFFVLTEKEFPDGAFIKLTNEFATADGGKLITTFKSDRKALADQFIHDLKVLSDEKKTYTPDELDFAVEQQEHRGSSLTHGLLFDPKKVMAQKKLDLVETEQGRPMEFRIPFFNMEATAAIPRHTSEYLPEEAAAAKKAFNDAFAQSKKRIAIAGGADMVMTKDGSFRLMEFNVGGESGYGMGDSAPVASNRIVAAIQGKDTKTLEELKAIDSASPAEQRKILQGLNENSKNMFLEETMISVRDSAMEKWKKSPTVANGRETIENLQTAFKGVIHDREHEGHEMILSAAQYMRRTHPEESGFDDLVKSIEKAGPPKPELDDAAKAAAMKAAAKSVDEATKYLDSRIETIAKNERFVADDLRPMSKAEEALGNRAVEATLNALKDTKVKASLNKIDKRFGGVAMAATENGADRFREFQEFKGVVGKLPATKRAEVYGVIARKVSTDPGPFGKALKSGAKVDENKLVAALRSSDNLNEAMGAKSPEVTHGLYAKAKMSPEERALADAVGISKASNESPVEAKAALTAELKSNVKRSPASVAPPKGSADKVAKEGLAEIEGLSDAQRAELAKSIATIEKNPNAAQAAAEHMQMMARNPDLFETYRMAYKGAGEAMAADSRLSREAAWKAGVAKMLKESGYEEGTEEFTKALHNTLACLKM